MLYVIIFAAGAYADISENFTIEEVMYTQGCKDSLLAYVFDGDFKPEGNEFVGEYMLRVNPAKVKLENFRNQPDIHEEIIRLE